MGISGAYSDNITTTTADIHWSTDQSATTELYLWYWDGGSWVGPTSYPDIGSGFAHTYPLTGLTSDTLYQVECRSYDPMVESYMSCDDASSPFNFNTDEEPPAPPEEEGQGLIPTIHLDNSITGGIKIGEIVFKNGIKYIAITPNILREFRR